MTDSESARSPAPERRGGGDLEPVDRGELGPARQEGASARALEVGEKVLITGGIFEGRTGLVEGLLPSGKLRVAVETRRSIAGARIDPTHLERLGILVEGTEEID